LFSYTKLDKIRQTCLKTTRTRFRHKLTKSFTKKSPNHTDEAKRTLSNTHKDTLSYRSIYYITLSCLYDWTQTQTRSNEVNRNPCWRI